MYTIKPLCWCIAMNVGHAVTSINTTMCDVKGTAENLTHYILDKCLVNVFHSYVIVVIRVRAHAYVTNN